MLKYYLLLAAVVVVALLYAYLADPCNNLVRMEFAEAHPDWRVLDSGPEEGSPESVLCHVSYRKPGGDRVYEDVWLYLNPGSGWTFSRVVATRERTP